MTSVRSHHQLLSGSKLWLLLLCALFVGACSSQKKAGGPPKGYEVVGDTKGEPKPPKTPKDTILPPIDDIIDSLGKYKHKEVYNIALVLPFYLDSFPMADGGIYTPSRIGVEYYKGVLSALDTLKKSGLSVKLHVYDSYPETYLGDLIKGNGLKKMDLIIGPVFNSSMKLMAEYAKREGIPVWSPFSPAGDITTQNPFFFIANPRIETHAEQMIQFAADSFSKSNLIVLYQFNDHDKRYLEIYRNYIETHNQAIDDSLLFNPRYKKAKIKVTEKFIEDLGKISTSQLEGLLDVNKRNVFIVLSMKVPFLVNLLRELYPLVGKHEISMIGTPALGNDVDYQLDYLNALDVHYTQSYYLGPDFYESDFYASFWETYKIEPSEYSVNGYDQMLFLGVLLKKYGLNFRVELHNDVFEGIGNGFTMQPVQLPMKDNKTTMGIDYWDNQHIYILRIKDFLVERVR